MFSRVKSWVVELVFVSVAASCAGQVSMSLGGSAQGWQGDGWTLSASGWRLDQAAPGNGTLTSPIFEVKTRDYVGGSFLHSFNLDLFYDGGQVYLSKNGGPWTYLQNSRFGGRDYDWVSSVSSTWMKNSDAFSGVYAGQTTFNLGASQYADVYNAGDTLQLRFIGAFSANAPSPDSYWQIASFTMNNVRLAAVPESAAVSLLHGFGAFLVVGIARAFQRRRCVPRDLAPQSL